MGSEVCANGLDKEVTISSKLIPICIIPKLDSPIVEEKTARRLPESLNLPIDQRPTSVGSVISDSNRANAEQLLNVPCQFVLVSSPDLIENGSLTPKDSIFDPFAPVHDKFGLAPPRRKCVEESRNNVVRRLNFSSTTNSVIRNQEAHNETISEEEQMLEIVYRDLLDVIASEQTKEFASKSLSQVLDSDGLCTPKFAARLTGIAETCPGAPKKSISKYRNIDKTICRKLDY